MLVADSQGRFCGSIMRNILDLNVFEPLCFCLLNADFEEVAKTAVNIGQNFNKADYIFILAGTSNAMRHTFISETFLKDLTVKFSHTNLSILSTPFWENNTEFNSIILKNNTNIRTAFRSTACLINPTSVLSRSDFGRNGLHLNRKGKRKVIKYIKYAVLVPFVSTSI